MARTDAAPKLLAAELGLGPTEAVLRGGALRQPVILSQLVVVDGKQWLRLRKCDQELRAFLHPPGERSKKALRDAAETED